MPKQGIRYKLANGQAMTVRQIESHHKNTWPVSYQAIYQRLKAGERDLDRLLREPNHGKKVTVKTPSGRVSPWRLGNALSTDNARRSNEEFLEARRKEIDRTSTLDLTGARYGALTVQHPGPIVDKSMTWTCKCDCGTVVTYRAHMLQTMDAADCGCGLARKSA